MSAATRATWSASGNAASPTALVGIRPPKPLGEGTPAALCHQAGLYQCALGGCAPGYVIAVVASCWG